MIKIVVLFSILAVALGSNCTYYCNTIDTNCVGGNAQWTGVPQCMSVCPALPLGTDGAQSGNSLACRIYHAEVAGTGAAAAATHCPHAGPMGNSTCGTACEGFCSIADYACTGTNSIYTNDADCKTVCATYDTSGTTGDATGATYQCRLYHAEVAITGGDATTHCPHASPSGGSVCGTMTENYCQVVQGACAGANAQYTSLTDCTDYTSTLAQIPLGTAGDTSGNTVGCRLYHAGVASQSPSNAQTHCPHAGKSGDDTCGTWCQVYCQLVMDNCVGSDSLYADNNACMTACANFATTGTPNTDAGDSVQCRIYHAGVAGTSGAAATTHCPHAGPSGGGVCIAPPSATTGSSSAAHVAVSFALLAVAAILSIVF